MKKYLFLALAVLFIFSATNALVASDNNQQKSKAKLVEANVWTTADGVKHYVCPVTKKEGVVDKNTVFSIVDGKKYYHCCQACAPKFQAEPQKYLKKLAVPANVVKIDKNGDEIFQCPVSGEKGVVDKKTSYLDVDGKRYYFCCDKCKAKFEKDPNAFLNAKK